MSVARRPLLTAAAAGILLCALWFVPSARGGHDQSSPRQQPAGYSRTSGSQQLALGDTHDADATPYLITGVTVNRTSGSQQLALGDTHGAKATPYLIAGAAVLVAGAGFGVHVIRRGARPA